MSIEDLRKFLLAMASVEESGRVYTAPVRIQVAGDDSIVEQWIPSIGSIHSQELRDPGFGSGPVAYADLNLVEVRKSDWIRDYGERGLRAFLELQGVLDGESGLDLAASSIAWRRGAQ